MTASHIPGFDTRAVHAGAPLRADPDAQDTLLHTAARLITPDHPGAMLHGQTQTHGSVLTDGHAACMALEERVAALEEGTAALSTASGDMARFLIFHTLMEPGDTFVAARQIAEDSINQFTYAFRKCAWTVIWADINDIASFENAITPGTRAIFIESISTPGSRVSDIAEIARIACRAGVPLIVDNTLASPYLCQPATHGADIILHSNVHLLCGHDHATGGLIIDSGSFNWSREGRYPSLSEPCPFHDGLVLHETFGNFSFIIACRLMNTHNLGASLSPFNATLTLTGIETLPLRMQRHCENARAVAAFLNDHPEVTWIDYAGLAGNRYHKRAAHYCPNGVGATFSFGVKGGYEAAARLVSNSAMMSHSGHAGTTRSLIRHPASMSNAPLSPRIEGPNTTEYSGAQAESILLSVGIENKEDIIADLNRAIGS